MDQPNKIFCGSGKSYGQYGNVGVSVCLSDIPKEFMSKDKNGKTWCRLNVCTKKDKPGEYYLEVNTWQPNSQPQGAQNAGQYQQPQQAPAQQPAFDQSGFQQPQSGFPQQVNAIQEGRDIPF